MQAAPFLAKALGIAVPAVLPIAIGVSLVVAFFGGGSHKDNPANMPDKYDTTRFGQMVADLRGSAGANGRSFTEDSQLAELFGGKTGIQFIEQTLAQ